jgi:adenosine deaminase
VLGAERLGHGIRSVDDPALLAHLQKQGVVLDICPTSNIRTGAVASAATHPLRRLFDAGVRVTLNTDDPIFFGTTMNDEYRLAARMFGFDASDLTALVLNGVRASFLPQSDKLALTDQLEREIAALRAELGV